MTQLAIKWSFSFSLHPTSASALPHKTKQTKYALNRPKKTIKFRFSGYVATNSQSIILQGLTVVQQHVY